MNDCVANDEIRNSKVFMNFVQDNQGNFKAHKKIFDKISFPTKITDLKTITGFVREDF
jgi:hypothetical protein